MMNRTVAAGLTKFYQAEGSLHTNVLLKIRVNPFLQSEWILKVRHVVRL